MVSGLVTSPCDQLRIFSGEASEMRMASKSVIGLVSSNGLERYKSTLLGTWLQIDNSKACLAAIPEVILLGLSSSGVRTSMIFETWEKTQGLKPVKFWIAYGTTKVV